MLKAHFLATLQCIFNCFKAILFVLHELRCGSELFVDVNDLLELFDRSLLLERLYKLDIGSSSFISHGNKVDRLSLGTQVGYELDEGLGKLSKLCVVGLMG